ncbi:HpcH/HpaI aldolase/citrate lyase family protein [Biformimicrobium ophioploci]|uniref:Itaconate degradation C-C-lyase RipC n=1 Tax=Biformimicrobium ophioploci TaxID=3036711 RepID=A0ABQ6LWC4_9GAMM|nr:CoA ester lyase [Microbulbifer sp. NKW57]GMG86332.1 itaconate degradation C-C-lyase RipC [Microbulbifer sp. NKW57]
MLSARSLLFVPGNRPERFAKALASSADLVCVDLEDAVPAAEKSYAREQLVQFLNQSRDSELARIVVRVSAIKSEAGQADLAALKPARLPAMLMLAKTECAQDLTHAATALGRTARWIPLVESARGLLNIEHICASESLSAVMFGGGDFAADLGARFAWEPLLWARSQIAVAAAAFGLPAIDVPHLDIADKEAVLAEAQRVAALGFSAKAAIHPAQIEAIHQGFMPSDEALLEAQEIVRAFEVAEGGAVVVNGCMVDQPIVDSARNIITRARCETTEAFENEEN